jgi:hypothetical protein
MLALEPNSLESNLDFFFFVNFVISRQCASISLCVTVMGGGVKVLDIKH